jgi:SAM-dependent methyltransferase
MKINIKKITKLFNMYEKDRVLYLNSLSTDFKKKYELNPPPVSGCSYLTSPIKSIIRALHLLQKVKPDLDHQTLSILDIGSGYGTAVKIFKCLGFLSYGVEIDPLKVRSTKVLFPDLEARIKQADILELPNDYFEQFDIIYMFHPLNYYYQGVLYDRVLSIKNITLIEIASGNQLKELVRLKGIKKIYSYPSGSYHNEILIQT